MSSPTDLIAGPDAVVLDLDAETGDAAVRALHARLAEVTEAVIDPPKLLRELQLRMLLAPVCIANDVALPHARTDGVSRIVLAVARIRQPIPFDAAHPAVQLLFLMGTPKDAVTGYLQAVAALSRFLRKPGMRDGLCAATDETEFRALLSGGVAARR